MKTGLAALSLMMLFGCAAHAADISNAMVIDVRTADEFRGGHAEGAVNIPYGRIVAEIGRYELKKDRQIYVYCASGARSDVAKKSLERAGYTNVINGGSLRRMRKILRTRK